jgi:hypothetical protein
MPGWASAAAKACSASADGVAVPTWPIIFALAGPPAVPPTEPPPVEAKTVEIDRVVLLEPDTPDPRIADVVAAVRANVPPDEFEIVSVKTPGPSTLGVRVVAAQDAASAHDARAVFWFDLRHEEEYLVYVYVRDRSAVLRRRVPEAAQSPEVAIETMWLIVRSGAMAIASGSDAGMEMVDPDQIKAEVEAATKPKEAEPEVVAPPPVIATSEHRPPDLRGVWLSFGYLGEGLARSMPWQSGGSIELAYAVHRFVKIGVGYGVVGGWPVRRPTEFHVLRHEVAAVLGIGGSVRPRLRIEARVLPAVELSQWRTPADDNAGLRVVGKAAAELVFRIWLVPQLALDLGGGASVAFNRFDFVLCEATAAECSGEDRRVVLSPWRVRPRARAGFSVLF